MRPRLPRASLASLIAATLFAGTLVTSRAQANGRMPGAQYVLAGHDGSDGTIVLRTTFGLAVSDDFGATFRYLCEDALGYGGTGFDPAVGLLQDRGILVGLFSSSTHVTPDRCTFPVVPSLAGNYITDFDVDPTGKVVVACTENGFTDDFNHLWRSDDGGVTFTSLGVGVEGTYFQSVEIAKTDSKRIWASALQLSPRRVIVFRSDDGGATLLDEASFPYPDAIFAVISAIDAKKPDVAYARVEVSDSVDGGSSARRTKLVRTSDGGATWRDVVESAGEMLGFALHDDGTTMWMGGNDDGLQRSTDGGATWTRIGDAHVQCLRWMNGVLYVCGHEGLDTTRGIPDDRFALADSCDLGTTLHPLVGFAEFSGPATTCAPDSPETTKCPTRWDDGADGGVLSTFPRDDLPREPLCSKAGDAGPFDADATSDADDAVDAFDSPSEPDAATDDATLAADTSSSNAPEAGSSGCGCAIVGGDRHAREREGAAFVVLGALIFGARRRRRPSMQHARADRT